MLDPLLAQNNGHVLHMGAASKVEQLDFDKIGSADYGSFKATAQAYAADTLLAANFGSQFASKVSHEMHDPGVVNTGQVKNLNIVLRYWATCLG